MSLINGEIKPTHTEMRCFIILPTSHARATVWILVLL